MAKFIKVALKKTMLRVAVDGQEKWATCTPQVLGYTKNTFKGGEEVDIQSEASGELGFHITRISKAGQGGGTSTAASTNDKSKCPDCGKDKEAKYPKCWACNDKNPAPKKSGGGYGKNSPEVSASIKRQAIGHMTSRTLIALTGQVDRNSVTEMMEVLYKKYQELVG